MNHHPVGPRLLGVGISVGLALLASVGQASGHFTSAHQNLFPAFDLNDTYVFASSADGRTSIISSANPSAPGTPDTPDFGLFGANGLYNVHIATDAAIDTGMTLTFSFDGDLVKVGMISSPNGDIGDAGEQLGSGAVGSAFDLANGVRVWTGRGQDPFFGNGVDLAKFNAAKQGGRFTPEVFSESGDLFAAGTASFIVVDLPNEMLDDEIAVFTTSAVNDRGSWRQVDRHANVLFPYVFLADTPAVQYEHDQSRPDTDDTRRAAIVNNVFWAASTADPLRSDAAAYAADVGDMLMPDVLTYRLGSAASYKIDAMNGRPLQDDAMNTVLQVLTGVPVDDNANDQQRYSDRFPYIVATE